jgi:hypothetical protein
MCSNCSGDYEDPEMTQPDGEPFEPSVATIEPPAFPSPLVGVHKLDVSWEDL